MRVRNATLIVWALACAAGCATGGRSRPASSAPFRPLAEAEPRATWEGSAGATASTPPAAEAAGPLADPGLAVTAASVPEAPPPVAPPPPALEAAPSPVFTPMAVPVPRQEATGDLVVRPILLVGLGAIDGGASFGAELGLRVGSGMGRLFWRYSEADRSDFQDDGPYLTWQGLRIDWIVAEGEAAALHLGAGIASLTYHFPRPVTTRGVEAESTASAFLIGAGVSFFQRHLLGPLLTLQVEALLGAGSGAAPDGRRMAAPGYLVSLNFTPLALLKML